MLSFNAPILQETAKRNLVQHLTKFSNFLDQIKAKKSSLVSGNRPGEKNFTTNHSPARIVEYVSEYIFLISKEAKKSKKTKQNKTKQEDREKQKKLKNK